MLWCSEGVLGVVSKLINYKFEHISSNMGEGEGATKRVDMITFHGCEKDLAGALGAHYDIICSGHTNSCQNVSRDDIEDGTFSSGKACFCDGDR